MRGAYAWLGVSFAVLLLATWWLVGSQGGPHTQQESRATPRTVSTTHETTMSLTLTSPAFAEGDMIPARFTCDGENVSPPLRIEQVPQGTKSLALILEDPDIPLEVREQMGIDVFDHWVLYNVSPDVQGSAQGEAPGTEGKNTTGEAGYTGPCPPPQYEPSEHRYVFTLYALSEELSLEAGATKEALLGAMQGRILDTATLIGRYARAQER